MRKMRLFLAVLVCPIGINDFSQKERSLWSKEKTNEWYARLRRSGGPPEADQGDAVNIHRRARL